eukprot:9593796-Ditylum_brightwellii.AAC.1
MQEKLWTTNAHDTFSDKEDVIELLKAINCTIFKFDNTCNIYIAMGNIVNRFWHFFQARGMSNIVYYEKFKNLIKVTEEYNAIIGLHPELLSKEAADSRAPTEDEMETTKGKFVGRMFVIKAYTMLEVNCCEHLEDTYLDSDVLIDYERYIEIMNAVVA